MSRLRYDPNLRGKKENTTKTSSDVLCQKFNIQITFRFYYSHFIPLLVQRGHCFPFYFRLHRRPSSASTETDSPEASSTPHSDSSHLIFRRFLCRIMNKIIIVCSMKFLPHFPLLMIILFKVYQLENILCNLNTNDSTKYVWQEHNIVCSYCFFIF